MHTDQHTDERLDRVPSAAAPAWDDQHVHEPGCEPGVITYAEYLCNWGTLLLDRECTHCPPTELRTTIHLLACFPKAVLNCVEVAAVTQRAPWPLAQRSV